MNITFVSSTNSLELAFFNLRLANLVYKNIYILLVCLSKIN